MSLDLDLIYSQFNFKVDKSYKSKIYEFEEFRLDAVHLMLYQQDEEIPLAPKAVETLLALVEKRGEILSKDELMKTIWTDSIVEESNLAQYLHLLRKILGETKDGKPFIETFRRRGYRFNGEVKVSDFSAEIKQENTNQSFVPPALTNSGTIREATSGKVVALADWRHAPEADEKSPQKILPAAQAEEFPSESETLNAELSTGKIKSRKRGFAVGSIILLLASIGLGYWFFSNRSSNAAIQSIAVLPFKPLVVENRDEALEMGMADTLIARLGNNREIIVRPLSSVRKYGNLEQDALQAGRALNVESVLDGSIQRWGDKIRVNVRLIKVADGSLLWAETFDEKFTDIFVVQDAISRKVASALALRLSGEEKNGIGKSYTKNVEAYQFYLKGRFQIVKLTPSDSQKGISYFQQAIEIDPNYAPAYVGLASAYRSLALAAEMPSTEFLPKAKAAASKAIEIDETLADAHAELGYNIFWYDWDWKAAEYHDKRAIEIDPNSADAHFAYAHLLSDIGRHPEALTEIRRARELDPLNLKADVAEGQFLLYAGQTDEALAKLQRTFEIDPNYWFAHLWASSAYIEKGMYEEAVAEARRARELSGVNSLTTAFEGYALAKSGKQTEAQTVLEELLKLSTERYVPPYNIALVYNGLGKHDETLDWLERGFVERDPRMVFLKVEPKWNNLRGEPRFIELMRRMNFE